MSQQELLKKINESLKALYGPRLRGLILYGSQARGDARDDSDVDLLALLDGPVETREIRRIVQATYELRLESGHSFHIVPGDYSHYQNGTYALYRDARKQGIALL